MITRYSFLWVLAFILVQGTSFAQVRWQTSRLPHLQDSLLLRYHWSFQGMDFYFKPDTTKTSFRSRIGKEVQRYRGAGDFIFFLDSLSNVKEVKLVNIEITKSGTLRFYDWRTFIKTYQDQQGYDIRTDIGISLDELHDAEMYKSTKDIAQAMLKELKSSIVFYDERQRRESMIVWVSMLF